MNKKITAIENQAEWSITLPQYSSSLQTAVTDAEMLLAINLSR